MLVLVLCAISGDMGKMPYRPRGVKIFFIIFTFLGFMRVAGRKIPEIDPRQHLGPVTQGTSPVTA
jgi:hypothetical protein